MTIRPPAPPMKYARYPAAKAVTPRAGLCIIYEDHWWVVEDDCLLFYRGFSAQCNSNRDTALHIAAGREVRFFERVFIPHRFSNEDQLVPDVGAIR